MKPVFVSSLAMAWFLAACAAVAPPVPRVAPCPKAVETTERPVTAVIPPGTAADRVHLFDELVVMVRRFHVFSKHTEANLGHTWEALVPRLKREIEAADTKEKLVVALHHFNASLHDMHSRFRTETRGRPHTLGFRIGVTATGRRAEFFVERVKRSELQQELREGDEIVSVDGVLAADLLTTHELVSEQNSWENIADDVGAFLSRRRDVRNLVKEGDQSTFVVRTGPNGAPRTVVTTWKRVEDDPSSDLSLPVGSRDCGNGDPKDYGPYELTQRGYRACLYTSKAPRFRDYPIVRHNSFHYDEVPHGPLVDHEMISRALASSHPKGVLVDVSENGGGINPNLFLEWWADKPYTDTFTRVRLDEAFSTKDKLVELVDNTPSPVVDAYLAAWKNRVVGQAFAPPRPFMCLADTCTWNNRHERMNRVTSAPVAVLVGPGCGSSCDAFVYHFDKHDFGPVVGRHAMAGYTTHRAHLPVRLGGPGGALLGTLTVAASYDTPEGSDETIEGKPIELDVEVPRTSANYKRYDRELVERAISTLEVRSRAASALGSARTGAVQVPRK